MACKPWCRSPSGQLEGAPVPYERYRPEQTPLYCPVQLHAATFFAEAEAGADADLPQFVKNELEACLECSIRVHGFSRLHCGGEPKMIAAILRGEPGRERS